MTDWTKHPNGGGDIQSGAWVESGARVGSGAWKSSVTMGSFSDLLWLLHYTKREPDATQFAALLSLRDGGESNG